MCVNTQAVFGYPWRPEGDIRFPELVLQVIDMELRSELGSSSRAASTLDSRTIFPGLLMAGGKLFV